ncbi:MAG: RpiB/LacA/LacB family sugar-phosphate isomerase [Actinomycetota bacterium]
MKVGVGSDARDALVDAVVKDLKNRGHEVVLVGPPAGDDIQWVEVGRKLGGLVATGAVENGVLFCWTGTGASIAANKVRGIRAALCTDAETAEGARKWNDANVLVMSLRLTTPTVASEMLDVWFATKPDPSERDNIALVEIARQKDREQATTPVA